MTKLIVLKLDGDLQQGFRVTLEIGLDGERPETEITGKLPSAPDLVEQYCDWRSKYRGLAKAARSVESQRNVSRKDAKTPRKRRKIIKPQIYNFRALKNPKVKIVGSLKQQKQECRNQALAMAERLNTWLKGESFIGLREKCLAKVSPSEDVRVLIRSNNSEVWQLPWHEWDFLSDYKNAEIGVSTLEYDRVLTPPDGDKVRILAILGNSEGINLQEDKQLLEDLPNAVTTFLKEPRRQQFNDHLWKQHWDILFFAGHSQTEGKKGRIYLNQTDSLTLDELKYGLQKAVAGGLQLAIFNSCDGLGLVQELQSLHIPQMIVMREPVPDKVAQEFLKNFLQAFASGKSLYQAMQEARQRLQGFEDDFPCASWLPVIYQNPASVPFKWRDAAPLWYRLGKVFATSLVVTGLVMGARWLGVMQTWELETYNQLLQSRPAESADSRLLLVGADEEDIRQYKYPLADGVLAEVMEKLQQYQPTAIGLDIFRDQPVPPGHESLVAQLQQNHRILTVCFGTEDSNAVAPPPDSPGASSGFNDLLNDQKDDMVRRHLQSRTPNAINLRSPCKTPYSFSLLLAHRYLQAKGIRSKTTTDKNWLFGNVVFPRLAARSSGYQNLDARGNQVLINYRATPQIAQRVTINQVLTGKVEPEWVKNRVVLIGITAPSHHDDHLTPYGRMRGLEVHAHMVSQIISAVEDGRPQIWWLPQWGDAVWVWVWSLSGGMVVYVVRLRNFRNPRFSLQLMLTLGVSVSILYGLCWLVLLQGGWLPLVPTVLALLGTGGAIACVKSRHS
ncbi:MAG: CHASE2 domain-containing protein [Nostocaceae cyanobacterium]|nr:CHASE2 domain-containing protein [Nostocaceae cyanobacterium]